MDKTEKALKIGASNQDAEHVWLKTRAPHSKERGFASRCLELRSTGIPVEKIILWVEALESGL